MTFAHHGEASGATLLLTVEEAARELHIAKRRIYTLIADGSLASIKIGTSRRISRAALAAYVGQLEATGRGGAHVA